MTKLTENQKSFFRLTLLLPECLILLMAIIYSSVASGWSCVYVSSYHKGYAWSDGVERGLRSQLQGECELTQFDMDTKRQKGEPYKLKKAREIAIEIKKMNPDVIITSDDNAAKYLIVPYFRGDKTPVVFCGINWTVEEYGFPASNITGMIEVAPLRPMLEWARKLTPGGKSGLYIGADTLTEKKNYNRILEVAENLGLEFSSVYVNSQEEWQAAISREEGVDFIVLGSTSGIEDWDMKSAVDFVHQNVKKLTFSNHGWMMPVSILGFVKVPEEQGEWAAKTALAIHNGLAVQRIPIVANRQWEVYENTVLLKQSGIEITETLRARAKKYRQGL
jgi:ABC-type uncharacterized transport system substrate-binding protein